MIKTPRVIVLILSFNGKYLLDDSLSSYLENEYPNFEVAVIDNGSNDHTDEFVKKKYVQVKLIRLEKNKGYSGGFNYGLNYAFKEQNADYALISNNDVKVDNNVISELVKVAQLDSTIGFVTGKVYYYNKPTTLQTVGKEEHPVLWNGEHIGRFEEDKGQYDSICERSFADDVFTLVSKKLYNSVGGYDTNFFLQSEEYDWQARAKKRGFKIYYTPYAKIWHKESMTIGKTSAVKSYFDARNPMIVVMKHKDADFFRRYFWHHLKSGVFKNSVRVFLRDADFKKGIKIWQGFFSGIIWGFRNKILTIRHFSK